VSTPAVVLWIANVLLDTFGHLAFKSVAVISHPSELQRWKLMASRPVLWLGFTCFCLEFVAWLGLLSLIPLSWAVLLGSINIVAVMIAGRVFFGERLDAMRIAGMAFITVGVALTGMPP